MFYEPQPPVVESSVLEDCCLVTDLQTQTIAKDYYQLKVLNDVVSDEQSNFVTATSRYVVPADGEYLVAAWVRNVGLLNHENSKVRLYKNGVALTPESLLYHSSGFGMDNKQYIAAQLNLTEDDYIQVYIMTNSIGTRSFSKDIEWVGMAIVRIS